MESSYGNILPCMKTLLSYIILKNESQIAVDQHAKGAGTQTWSGKTRTLIDVSSRNILSCIRTVL
jgi:hypothetical protein